MQLYVYQRTLGRVLPRLDRRHSERQLIRGTICGLAKGSLLGLVHQRRLLAIPETIGRLHLRRQVRDPRLRAKLLPDHRLGCKRDGRSHPNSTLGNR